MEYKLCSCIFLLFSFSRFIFSQSHSFSSLESGKTPTPLDFLRNLIGTHRGVQAQGLSELRKYLAKLGYIDNDSFVRFSSSEYKNEQDFFDDTLELAIKRYQNFYHIKPTGILDQETIALLLSPRCGVPDTYSKLVIFDHGNSFEGSLYNVTKLLWPPNKRNLTYAFRQGTRKDAYAPVGNALARWASVSPFNFNLTDNFEAADVKISFEIREHGDRHPFDGPNGILAHGFYPTVGRLHFDAEEQWRSYDEKGVYELETVALHELGHILGLAHSKDPKAVMYAYVRAGEKKDLSEDDIQGIHEAYSHH